MTLIHVVRGMYLAVSVTVGLCAIWLSGGLVLVRRDRLASITFAAYALSVGAAQGYAFNLPLTTGTAFIGFGVLLGGVWLLSLALDGRKRP